MERPLHTGADYAFSIWEGDHTGAVLYVATGAAIVKPRLSEEALEALIEHATSALAEVRVAKQRKKAAA